MTSLSVSREFVSWSAKCRYDDETLRRGKGVSVEPHHITLQRGRQGQVSLKLITQAPTPGAPVGELWPGEGGRVVVGWGRVGEG